MPRSYSVRDYIHPNHCKKQEQYTLSYNAQGNFTVEFSECCDVQEVANPYEKQIRRYSEGESGI